MDIVILMCCVTDVLATDKQLASEIEYDLRKFEEQEKESQRQPRRSNIAVGLAVAYVVIYLVFLIGCTSESW